MKTLNKFIMCFLLFQSLPAEDNKVDLSPTAVLEKKGIPLWGFDLFNYPSQHSVVIGKLSKITSEKAVRIISEDHESQFIYSKGEFVVLETVYWSGLIPPRAGEKISALIPRLVVDKDRIIGEVPEFTDDMIMIFNHPNIAGVGPMILRQNLPLSDRDEVIKLLENIRKSNASR